MGGLQADTADQAATSVCVRVAGMGRDCSKHLNNGHYISDVERTGGAQVYYCAAPIVLN